MQLAYKHLGYYWAAHKHYRAALIQALPGCIHTSTTGLHSYKHYRAAFIQALPGCTQAPQALQGWPHVLTHGSYNAHACLALGTLLCCATPYLYFYCTVLYCTVLHCTALHYTALYCTILYCTVSTVQCSAAGRDDFQILLYQLQPCPQPCPVQCLLSHCALP